MQLPEDMNVQDAFTSVMILIWGACQPNLEFTEKDLNDFMVGKTPAELVTAAANMLTQLVKEAVGARA